MAVAVSPTPQPTKPPEPMGLAAASVVGAAFVLAAAALVLRGIPFVWSSVVGDGLGNPFVDAALLITLQVAAVVGLIWVGTHLAGIGQKTPGVRGGIFFMISVAFAVFFCGRALWLIAGRGFTFGGVVAMLFNVVILFLIVQFFRTGRFVAWSQIVDDAGWFSATNHKKTQGRFVRRLTIIGIIIIAGTGIWTLYHHQYLPANAQVKLADGRTVSNRLGDWVVGGTVLEPAPGALPAEENRARPRVEGGVTLLPDLQFTVPLLLIAATLWVAWRAVNYPQFADFLIATEAEINKVSWSSRRALIRDTIVVLAFLVLLTLFLFFVDIFWTWLLSHPWIGVLPSPGDLPEPKTADPVTTW